MKKSIRFLLVLSLLTSALLADERKQQYTIAHVSVTTDSGIIGFPVGTEVTPLKNGKFQIGTYEVAISHYDVSDDLTIVNAAIIAFRQGQAQLAEIQKQAQAQMRAKEEQEKAAAAQAAAEAAARLREQQSVSLTSGTLGATIRK